MPSTMRRRFASENDISGMNTAHARCTQPWPSVGLQTRRNESAGGCDAFLSRSRLGRAQRTQSGFCESHWSYKTALGTGRTYERDFGGLFILAEVAYPGLYRTRVNNP